MLPFSGAVALLGSAPQTELTTETYCRTARRLEVPNQGATRVSFSREPICSRPFSRLMEPQALLGSRFYLSPCGPELSASAAPLNWPYNNDNSTPPPKQCIRPSCDVVCLPPGRSPEVLQPPGPQPHPPGTVPPGPPSHSTRPPGTPSHGTPAPSHTPLVTVPLPPGPPGMVHLPPANPHHSSPAPQHTVQVSAPQLPANHPVTGPGPPVHQRSPRPLLAREQGSPQTQGSPPP